MDFNDIKLSTVYTSLINTISGLLTSLAKRDFTGNSNIPVDTIRLNKTTRQEEKYTGSAWEPIGTLLPPGNSGNDVPTGTAVTSAIASSYNSGKSYTDSQIVSLGNTVATALAGKQNNLNFSPVQQGGGIGQGGNKIYIGWSGVGLKYQVDGSDRGNFWDSSNFNPNTKQNAIQGALYAVAAGYFSRVNGSWATAGCSAQFDTFGNDNFVLLTFPQCVVPIVQAFHQVPGAYGSSQNNKVTIFQCGTNTNQALLFFADDATGNRCEGFNFIVHDILRA